MRVSNLECPHGYFGATLPCPYCAGYIATTDNTSTDLTTGPTWQAQSTNIPRAGQWWTPVFTPCPYCNPKPAPAPESAGGEEHMSLIDERQIALLDKARAAKDEAHRYFKSKNDKARLMEIQLEALRKEAAEGIAELNEDFPLPDDE